MIDRVASLLAVFDRYQRLTLAEISRQAALPRSSAHRILQHLVGLGWLERRGFEYVVGIRMFELGARAIRHDGVHQAALPQLHALYRATGLTAHLTVLAGADVVHLDRVGAWPLRAESWRVGARQDVVTSAAGRALLAQLDEVDWPELIFPGAPGRGARSLGQLRREIGQVRVRGGVAVDDRRCSPETTAVAVPVGPPEARLCTALSLCGKAGAVPVGRVSTAVRLAARDVWDAFSGVDAPPHRAIHRVPPSAGSVPITAHG